MKLLAILACAALAAPCLAGELQVQRDVPYAATRNPRQTLDVYAAKGAKDQPIVVYIHGGGWRRGDKAAVHEKPQIFADRGYVLVSINYRFVPHVTIPQMMSDVAKAIRHVHDHAREYGGDAKSIFVMGHSAGAHLAALACTDDRYLKAEGLTLANIKGCIPIDVSAYDIPKRLAETPDRTGAFVAAFGKTAEEQRAFSPLFYVAQGKHIPRFLILHVASRPETKSQAHLLADALRKAGGAATVVSAEGKTHGTINSELGRVDDKATQELWKFLES